jgi:mRNA interferase RelE/StbE
MYKVEFTPQAENSFARLDKNIAQRIANKIDWLSQNFKNITPEPLTAKFKGKYKLRVGDWRIIYSTNQPLMTITIYEIEHRSKIYKT